MDIKTQSLMGKSCSDVFLWKEERCRRRGASGSRPRGLQQQENPSSNTDMKVQMSRARSHTSSTCLALTKAREPRCARARSCVPMRWKRRETGRLRGCVPLNAVGSSSPEEEQTGSSSCSSSGCWNHEGQPRIQSHS